MGMLAVGRRRLFPWPSWFVTSDPCGLFCAFLTVCLMVFAHVVTVFLVLRGSQGLLSVHAILFTLCTVMALTSHCRAQFSDPGCVPKRCVPVNPPVAQAVDGNRTLLPSSIPVAKKALLPSVCRKCKTVKPRGTHHCSVCARCISKMDHHCPWINNCVAAFNQKYFLLFLCWTGVMCIYSGCVIGVGIYRCAQSLNQCSDISAVVVVCSMLNMFEAVLFGCFVSVMLWDQLSAIFENTPYIDKLQVGPNMGLVTSRKSDLFGRGSKVTPPILAVWRFLRKYSVSDSRGGGSYQFRCPEESKTTSTIRATHTAKAVSITRMIQTPAMTTHSLPPSNIPTRSKCTFCKQRCLPCEAGPVLDAAVDRGIPASDAQFRMSLDALPIR